MKNDVTLMLQKGAVLLGSTSMDDYPPNIPDYKFYRQGTILRALIYAENCSNIGIQGEGTIDGRGDRIFKTDGKKVKSYGERPHVIWMVKSKHIRVRDVSLRNSALWMEHYLACEDIHIHNIDVYNHCNKNNDMIDINGCKDVVISDCRGDSDDDGITLKSTHEMPCENILINNCVISSHCNAIKCGTETNVGFKNIVISNCVIRPSKDTVPIYGTSMGASGISLEVVDGAEMNGVSISNIVIQGTVVPLFLRLGNRARGYDKDKPKPETGSIQNITISNVTAYDTWNYTSSIIGIPGHNIKNVTLENIRFFSKGGGTEEQAKREVPELETEYPEAVMFDELPASGFYVRHAENITMKNVEFHFAENDKRPALYLDDVTGVKVMHLSSDMDPSVPMIFARDVRNVFVQNPVPDEACKSVIEVTGAGSKNIRLTEIDKRYFKKIFGVTGGAEKKEVKTGVVY
jgi:polygalacturonase